MTKERYIRAAKKIRSSVVPFVVLLAFFAAISWYIVKPLAIPLLWSILFSYFAYPLFKYLHERLFKGRMVNVAAGISTGVIMIFIALPLLLLSMFVTKEAIRISRHVMESGILSGSYKEAFQSIKLYPIFGTLMAELDLITELPIVDSLIKDSARLMTSFLTVISSQVLESLLKLMLIVMIVAITSFFLVRDGRSMINYITGLLPLREEERSAFISRTATMLRAVVCGIIMTAAVQGVLGAVGWWFVGLSHPVFFGFCMFMTAMIPFVGTPSIWLPGALALFFQGNISGGIILVLWGLCVVSTIDNFIKPVFISEGSNIHMLIIFIGLFGGLYAWGFLGVFVGPLILSLALFVLDIYHQIVVGGDDEEKPEGNLKND